jgi:Predicted transcriptional regulator
VTKTTHFRESRFRLLWSLLSWEGELRNRRLQDLFGLTSVQASRLIAQFRDEHPGTIENDPVQKRWIPASAPSSDGGGELEDYLGTLEVEDAWFEDGRVDFLTPDRRVFAVVREACVSKAGLDTMYASMTHPKGHHRLLYPHTMVRLMQRWHVRAWCTQRESYCDFTLGRMSRPTIHGNPKPGLPRDTDWEERIDVRLGAHRALGIEQEQIIRGEYFGGAVARRLRVRRALVNYVINDIRAAIDPKRQVPPEFYLEVLNADEVQQWLFSSV